MARKNPGDILTCDWNPIIGCERFSAGCRSCWYLDGIFPWQQRLGNIPPAVRSEDSHVFPTRLTEESLFPKNGIVGVVQHGDLFRDRVPDQTIEQVLATIKAVAARKRRTPTYILWTKRAKRMVDILERLYPAGMPPYLAAAISVEDQACADERLPEFARIKGTRIIVLEPLLGPVDLSPYLPVDWLVVGSETGKDARPLNLEWVRLLRDQALVASGIPLFVKQLGMSHKEPQRELDGRTWDQFPEGFTK